MCWKYSVLFYYHFSGNIAVVIFESPCCCFPPPLFALIAPLMLLFVVFCFLYIWVITEWDYWNYFIILWCSIEPQKDIDNIVCIINLIVNSSHQNPLYCDSYNIYLPYKLFRYTIRHEPSLCCVFSLLIGSLLTYYHSMYLMWWYCCEDVISMCLVYVCWCLLGKRKKDSRLVFWSVSFCRHM